MSRFEKFLLELIGGGEQERGGRQTSMPDKEYLNRDLFLAAKTGKHDLALKSLVAGADVNAHDKNERTPLMHACYRGHSEIVKLLLSKAADVALADPEGETALSCAMQGTHGDIVRMLAPTVPELYSAIQESKEVPIDDSIRLAAEEYSAKKRVILLPITAERAEVLAQFRLPEKIVCFYRHYTPQVVRVDPRIWGLSSLLAQNVEYLPGTELIKNGFFVFASILSGDVYCFDLNEAPSDSGPAIYLFSHELSYKQLSSEEVRKKGKKVAAGLADFLHKAARDELDMEAIV